MAAALSFGEQKSHLRGGGCDGAPGEIRTHTGWCLRPLPLPLGYRGGTNLRKSTLRARAFTNGYVRVRVPRRPTCLSRAAPPVVSSNLRLATVSVLTMTKLGLCHQVFVLSITGNGLLSRSAISLRPVLVGAVIADCQGRGMVTINRLGQVTVGEGYANTLAAGGGAGSESAEWGEGPVVLRRLVQRVAENPGKSVVYWVEKLSRHVLKHIVADVTAAGVVVTRRRAGIAAGLTGDRFDIVDHELVQRWHHQVRAELRPIGEPGSASAQQTNIANEPDVTGQPDASVLGQLAAETNQSSVETSAGQHPVLPWLGLALQDCWRPRHNIPVLRDCSATKRDLRDAVKSYQDSNVLFDGVEQVIRSRRATFVGAVAAGSAAST